jgi:hypothetical protein
METGAFQMNPISWIRGKPFFLRIPSDFSAEDGAVFLAFTGMLSVLSPVGLLKSWQPWEASSVRVLSSMLEKKPPSHGKVGASPFSPPREMITEFYLRAKTGMLSRDFQL